MPTSSPSASRAALITGASSGIGLAIAHSLGALGYGLTVAARRPEKLELAAGGLRAEGCDVLAVPTQLADEAQIVELISAHRRRFGRLDVLVNNAGVGVAQPIGMVQTKHLDMQVAVNFRSAVIATRECVEMLRAAGAEHGKALVVNMASISGRDGWADLSVCSATKAALVALSAATQKELAADRVQVTALCPGLVDTPMAEAVPETSEAMIGVEDIARSVEFLLETSSNCAVPEIVFEPIGGTR